MLLYHQSTQPATLRNNNTPLLYYRAPFACLRREFSLSPFFARSSAFRLKG